MNSSHEIPLQIASELIDVEFYRYRRYQVRLSVVVICFENGAVPEGIFEKLEDLVRKTDLITQISHCTLFLGFPHTSLAESHRAMERFSPVLKQFSPTYYYGVSEAIPEDQEALDLIRRAIRELEQQAPECLHC